MQKPVKGYEGLYLVTDDGRVLGPSGQHRKLRVNPATGYSQVTLFRRGQAKCAHVHRLVAEAFIPNPEGKPQINHKNGNKQDNRVENLEWCTQSENLAHAYRERLRATVPVTAISKADGTEVRTFGSLKDAARFCGVSYTNGISQALSGHIQSAHGYYWKHATLDK